MKVDLDKLNHLVKNKYLSVQEHWEAPLLIYNYTPKVQYEPYWTPETIMCRGLIVDKEGNIKARPFPKFFNIGEHESEKLPDLPLKEHFDVYEKMDGSLGILYFIDNNPFIATRGSFKSDQAIEGTKILRHKYFDIKFNPDYTYLFEIIYPDNRIVVNYKDERDLYLLAVLNIETGEDIEKGTSKYGWIGNGPQNVFPEPIKFQFKQIDEIKKEAEKYEDDSEGFVIRFSSGVRAKVKYDEYVRLHRLLTGVNSRVIWDLLRNEQPFDELLEKVPDEFYNWVKDTKKDLEMQFSIIENGAKEIYKKVKKLETRKEQADFIISNYKHPSVVFSMLDKKDYKQTIWRLLRPKAEKPFKDDSENI